MTEETKIIIHSGKAHFDELLATALILASKNGSFKIFRRDPTEDELNDPETWVVDVGGIYDPVNLNFDHHQDDLPASFQLVAKHLGLDSAMRTSHQWWDFFSNVDTQGPFQALEKININPDSLDYTTNPLTGFIIKKFAEDPNSIIDLLKEFGSFLISNLEKEKQFFDLYSNSPIIELNGKHSFILIDGYSFKIHKWILNKSWDISISVSLDDRGEGWVLERLRNNLNVDFNRLADEPEMLFIHKTGFLAKTKSLISVDEIKKLLLKAIK